MSFCPERGSKWSLTLVSFNLLSGKKTNPNVFFPSCWGDLFHMGVKSLREQIMVRLDQQSCRGEGFKSVLTSFYNHSPISNWLLKPAVWKCHSSPHLASLLSALPPHLPPVCLQCCVWEGLSLLCFCPHCCVSQHHCLGSPTWFLGVGQQQEHAGQTFKTRANRL